MTIAALQSNSRSSHATMASLWRLARECGIEPAYTDVRGRRKRALPEAVLHATRALGVHIDTPGHARDALRAVREENVQRVVDPVVVLWRRHHLEGAQINLRLTPDRANSTIECRWLPENGECCEWQIDLSRVNEVRQKAGSTGSLVYKSIDLPLPRGDGTGYHRLELRVEGEAHRAWVFVAPQRTYSVPQRGWGVFVPTYAIRSRWDWGAGDLTDLGTMLSWVRAEGGTVIGTLPMLAAAHESKSFDPSPYAPLSRLFWNESYIDVEAAPEFGKCQEAQALVASSGFQEELERLRNTKLVDYPRLSQLKRRVMELLAKQCFQSSRNSAVEQLKRESPDLDQYARFRAAMEQRRKSWRQWPEEERTSREINASSIEVSSYRYHLYVQLLVREQLARLEKVNNGRHEGLYLDLPVGAHPDGFDTWRYRESFVDAVAAGAPPDDFFTHGQNWGFPPLHPKHTRANGHLYFRRCMHEHLRFAAGLRIDHVMWMHRVFWIPTGAGPEEGLYVRYPAEELYAIASIESNRARAWIVGENLGTVPKRVDRSMERHGISPLYVGQFSWTGDSRKPLHPPAVDAVASLNTHDTPTFAAFWRGLDIDERLADGLLSSDEARHEQAAREQTRRTVIAFLQRHRVCLRDNGESDADIALIAQSLLTELGSENGAILLVNLEDLWSEERPHNVPGTSKHTNWRRKVSHTLEELCSDPDLREALHTINEVMK